MIESLIFPPIGGKLMFVLISFFLIGLATCPLKLHVMKVSAEKHHLKGFPSSSIF